MLNDSAHMQMAPLTQRIHEAYGTLSDAERRIADGLLDSARDVAVLTATEIAQGAGVSNATVTRFFRRLGYESFDQARQQARLMRAAGSPLYTGHRATADGLISAILHSETAVLDATLGRLDAAVIEDIARMLAQAPRIRTLGYRNSHFLAEYMTAQLGQMRRAVSPLLLSGQTQAEGIALLSDGDVAIVVGLRRRPAVFNQVLAEIAGRGAKVLLIADQTVRKAPAVATWTLICDVDTPQFADAYSGALALLRLIAVETHRILGSSGRSYLEDVETLRARLGELE